MIKAAFYFAWKAFLVLAPLLILLLGLPLNPEFQGRNYEYLTLGLIYAALILIAAGQRYSPILGQRKVFVWLATFFVLTAPLSIFFIRREEIDIPAAAALLLVGALAFSWGLWSDGKKFPAPGILTLLIMISGFMSFEALLRAIPANMVLPTVLKVPALTPLDRGNQLFRKNGFRGERPRGDPTHQKLRIFTMGGSSTFGTPMFSPNDTYAARLETKLRTRRPGEPWEVFNAGIAGYGITQIQDSIDKEIGKHHPDIIIICAWFNDSAAIPGWYGYPTKSDKESYELIEALKKVEKLRLYRGISATRTYGLFRFWVTRAQDKLVEMRAPAKKKKRSRRRRMSPDEFRWGIERIVNLSQKYGFLPVLLTEPTNHTPGLEMAALTNPYYRVMQEQSQRHNLPLINVLDEFHKHHDEWMFYDFIHPNQRGHELIAERIFSALFEEPINPRLKEVLVRHNIKLERPLMRPEYSIQIPRKALAKGELTFTARSEDPEPALLEVVVDGQAPLVQSGVSSEPKTFTFQLGKHTGDRPLLDVTIWLRPVSATTGGSKASLLELRDVQIE